MINIFKSKQRRMVDKWKRDLGDKTLRLDYDLNKNSVVFDVGGYKGEWTEAIYFKYNCNVHVFEPVERFSKMLKEVYSKIKKIKVYRFGLGNKDKVDAIYIDNDSSSIYGSGFKEFGEFKDIVEFIKYKKIKKIDLMKINIEGGEYELLLHLISNDYTKDIKDIQVQFHNNIPHYKLKRDYIRMMLEQTHYLTYDYPFVWENWRRK